jgi:hypothetical protein
MFPLAHVKWFADFDFGDRPATLVQALSPTFLALAALSFVAVGVLAVAERRLEGERWYVLVNRWLAARAEHGLLVLRVTAGASLLLSWQADALLAPELPAAAWMGWAQFAAAFLLLFARTVPIAGALMLGLFAVALVRQGAFHMLDYLHFAGVAWFLVVARSRHRHLRESRIPVLYLTVGFSLCWLAMEKLLYPQWTLYLLEQNPGLTLGLDPDFFRVAAAFVEFALGYLLIICLFQRPLALVITSVFFMTTLVFGKTEVIGHTLVHGALIVFLLEGPGRFYRPPIAFHERTALRAAFAAVNYVILLGALLAAYAWAAWHIHHQHGGENAGPFHPSHFAASCVKPRDVCRLGALTRDYSPLTGRLPDAHPIPAGAAPRRTAGRVRNHRPRDQPLRRRLEPGRGLPGPDPPLRPAPRGGELHRVGGRAQRHGGGRGL